MHETSFQLQQPPGSGEGQVLKVSGEVTIRDARGFHEALLAALEGANELRVDLRGMTDIDLAGLQLLCAAHHSAGRAGKSLEIVDGGNTTFRDMATGAGFRRHAGCGRDVSGNCIWVEGES